MMVENIILWRHADAEIQSVSGQDLDRALTRPGQKDAAKMAKWLNQHLPKNTQIFCSPARRCLETVAALQQLNVDKMPLEVTVAEFLGVDRDVNSIVKKLGDNDGSKTILMIGHQPNFGSLISKLLDMQETACVVKKGAVWWLRQRRIPSGSASKANVTLQTYLFAVQHPDYLQ